MCGCGADRISVKATTTEKLGVVGRKEGCEVWATVLMVRANRRDSEDSVLGNQ